VGAVLANIDGGCVLSFSTSLATVISDFENWKLFEKTGKLVNAFPNSEVPLWAENNEGFGATYTDYWSVSLFKEIIAYVFEAASSLLLSICIYTSPMREPEVWVGRVTPKID
jgi:hypothetical protein